MPYLSLETPFSSLNGGEEKGRMRGCSAALFSGSKRRGWVVRIPERADGGCYLSSVVTEGKEAKKKWERVGKEQH